MASILNYGTQRQTAGVFAREVTIRDHPHADRLEIALLDGGESCVVAKGAHRDGETVLFVPVGAQLPDYLIDRLKLDPHSLSDNRRGTRNVVRRLTLRGVPSDGLLLRPEEHGFSASRDVDYSGALNVYCGSLSPYAMSRPKDEPRTPTVRAESNVGRFLIKHGDQLPEDVASQHVGDLPEPLQALPVFSASTDSSLATSADRADTSKSFDRVDVLALLSLLVLGFGGALVPVAFLDSLNVTNFWLLAIAAAIGATVALLLSWRAIYGADSAHLKCQGERLSLLPRFDVVASAEGDRAILTLRRWFHRPKDGWHVAPLYARAFAGADLQAAAAAKVELQQHARCLTLAAIADDHGADIDTEMLCDPDAIEEKLRAHITQASANIEQLAIEAQRQRDAEQEARETAAILQAQIEDEQRVLLRA